MSEERGFSSHAACVRAESHSALGVFCGARRPPSRTTRSTFGVGVWSDWDSAWLVERRTSVEAKKLAPFAPCGNQLDQVLSGTLARPYSAMQFCPRVRSRHPVCARGWLYRRLTKHCVNRGLRTSEMKWPLLEFGKKLVSKKSLSPTPQNHTRCPPSLPFRPPPCDGGQRRRVVPGRLVKACKRRGKDRKKKGPMGPLFSAYRPVRQGSGDIVWRAVLSPPARNLTGVPVLGFMPRMLLEQFRPENGA